jgi:D-alanyl-D-alanine carboxypeptidase
MHRSTVARAAAAKSRTPIAVLATIAVAVAACGDGDAATDGPASAAATAPTAETPVVATIDEAALQVILDQWRSDVGTFGATLSIRVPGHDDIHLASGVDDRNPDTPMPIDGTFLIGTSTRTFVAAAALQLVDEGRLSLDESVEPWLPELPNADQVTLAMLLGFTSGLPQQDNAADGELIIADLTRQFTPEEVLAIQLEQPIGAPPGEEFGVGIDTGYVAAGLLIERELGEDLAAVIEERFAGPLGLDDTEMWGPHQPTPSRHGWFSVDGNPDRPIDILDIPFDASASFNFASRNMISSSRDMLDWGEALLTGELLSEETTATMLTMRNSFSPIAHYGLGVAGYCLDPSGCEPDDVDLVGYTGGTNGVDTHLVHHPESGTTFEVHANIQFEDDTGLPNLLALEAAVLEELGLT